jgi:hypothetical protein
MSPEGERTEVPVRSLNRCAMLAVVLVVSAAAAHADQVVFQNELSACVTIKKIGVTAQSNVVLANTHLQLRKPIGECGCLSALASYTSYVNRGGVQQVLQAGLVGLASSGEKTFVLASDPALVANMEIQVRLACGGPL